MIDRTRTVRAASARLVCAGVAVLAAAAVVAGCAATRSQAAPWTGPSTATGVVPGPGISPLPAPSRRAAEARGRILVRAIPGGPSRFVGRPAVIYLPPRVLHHPQARMPVVALLHGVPGGPTSWLLKGDLVGVADTFAGEHGGAAPIIVMPDINGTQVADTECIRTPGGADVEQYLARVVPTWIARNLPATTDHRRWTVAGLSEGGTCAAMLSLRHPQVYPTFGDLSGLAQPTVGPANTPALTTRALFGGSVTAYDEHDPLWLLRRGHVGTTAAFIAAGAGDREDRSNQSLLASAALADGIPVRAIAVPGGHHWPAWTSALEQMLPWFWTQTGT